MVKLYRLQMRLLQDPELTRKFFVYTKSGRSLSPAAESFIAFLFKFVADHEWNVTVARPGLSGQLISSK
jgi:DNA-binding transcriptional LysR family regulator